MYICILIICTCKIILFVCVGGCIGIGRRYRRVLEDLSESSLNTTSILCFYTCHFHLLSSPFSSVPSPLYLSAPILCLFRMLTLSLGRLVTSMNFLFNWWALWKSVLKWLERCRGPAALRLALSSRSLQR